MTTSHLLKLDELNSKSIVIDGITISYFDIGEGKPILLLPSFPLSKIEFYPLVNYLKNHRRCLSLDIPCWLGKSEAKNLKNFENLKNLIVKFIKSQNLKNFDLLGYSMGGILAMAVKNTIPDKVDSVYLISSPSSVNKIITKKKSYLRAYSFFRFLLPSKIIKSVLLSRFRKSLRLSFYKKDEVKAINFLYDEMNKLNIKKLINSFLLFKGFKFNKIDNFDHVNILISKNDPKYIKESFKDSKEKFENCRFNTINSSDHNHLFFDPIHTYRFIKKVEAS